MNVNTNRRHALQLAALSATAFALPDLVRATVTDARVRLIARSFHKTFWNNTQSCDNKVVPVSQRGARLATVADFGSIYPGYYVERAIYIHFKVHVGNRAFLTTQAFLPEPDNAAVVALAPYKLPRKGKRITNAREADWGLPTMKVIERQQTRLAVLVLALSV